jgi:hypothetical protein
MRTIIAFCGLLLGFCLATRASDRTFTIVTNAPVVNHWPGPDGFVGTADDVVNAGLSAYEQSSPNEYGSYSFIVTTLGQNHPQDPWLFGGYDTATFVLGSVTIDTAQFVTNDIPLLKAIEFSGTELFPGHGPYTVKLTSREGGSSTHTGNLFNISVRFDFQGTFNSGTAIATNATANGRIVLLNASQYAAPDLTGAPNDLANYIRTVAIPVATANNASGFICGDINLQTSGSLFGIPGDTGFFPALTAYGVVFGLDLSPPASSTLDITNVVFTADGLRLQWSPLAGQTYSVQATSGLGSGFTTIATNLSQPEFTDQNTQGQRMRFYRVSAP